MLERTGWRVRGAGSAAEVLGLKPTPLEYRMKKLGIRRPARRTAANRRPEPGPESPQ